MGLAFSWNLTNKYIINKGQIFLKCFSVTTLHRTEDIVICYLLFVEDSDFNGNLYFCT